MDDVDWTDCLRGVFGSPDEGIHELSGRLGQELNADSWRTVRAVADQAYQLGKKKGEDKWIS